MKLLVSPEFSAKLSALNAENMQSLSAFISSVESLERNDLLSSSSFKISVLEDDIYFARLPSGRLFFTLEKDGDEDYLLLMDVTSIQAQPNKVKQEFFTPNNPRVNKSINPKLNSSINPKFNSSINPKMNSSLNPKMNRSYGGPYLYDTDLNQISYIVKASSNVELVYSPDIELLGFLVDANESVKIEFDANNNWVGYFVKANEQVWLRYSSNGEWIGLLV